MYCSLNIYIRSLHNQTYKSIDYLNIQIVNYICLHKTFSTCQICSIYDLIELVYIFILPCFRESSKKSLTHNNIDKKKIMKMLMKSTLAKKNVEEDRRRR